jgi:mono/diheme cytochrome c family protein
MPSLRALAPLIAFSLSCGGSAPPTARPAEAEQPAIASPVALDDAHGGRLYDAWIAASGTSTFVPDDRSTAGVADGRGGPTGDGTLRFGDGRVLFNDTGHDYRLKNLFGWDLRGSAGIYGAAQMNRAFVLDTNLLEWTGDVTAVADRLERGDTVVPAFGAVVGRADLEAIATFVVGVRDHTLPHPEAIFALTTRDAGHYALSSGGDAERGRAIFAQRCAQCHGPDGTQMLFDDGEYSLGTHARQKAYEDWMKMLNGQPGSPMGRQVRGDAGAMTREILDLFAALCDRSRFPRGAATGADVADGDPRCGAYLR